MTFIDTHTHLYADQFDNDRQSMIEAAIARQVTRFYLPNIDHESIAGMLALEEQFPGQCLPMMGLHPCSVNANYEEELALVEQWLGKRRFAAIGEIGIDLYWDKTFIAEQEIAFRRQLNWALEFGYTVSIHCRSAFDEIYAILKSYPKLPKCIFHCFSGNTEQAQQILALGNFKLGIGGVVTFKNSGLDKVVESIALEHLVLETDAPYLAPAPHRGKRNESAYIPLIAEKIASIKGITLEEVAAVTSQNALDIFEN